MMRAARDPSGTAARCKVSNATPNPARAGAAFANTKPARKTKSYQGRVVGGMRTRQNGWTMKVQAVNTMRLRADADRAVHRTGLSIKTAASHITNAREMLSHIECRWAMRT